MRPRYISLDLKSQDLNRDPFPTWAKYKIIDYLKTQFEVQRQRPSDNLIAALIQARDQGARLSDDDLLADTEEPATLERADWLTRAGAATAAAYPRQPRYCSVNGTSDSVPLAPSRT